MGSWQSATVRDDPWRSETVRIAGMTVECPGITTYHLEPVDPQVARGYSFLPGQFNMLYVPGAGEIAIGVSRAFAPAATGTRPEDSAMTLDHTIRLAGRVTGALARIGLGGTLGLRGPFGTPWPIELCSDQDVVLVAGGTGLASLRAALYQLLENHSWRRLILLYGSRTPEVLLYQREYPLWIARGLHLETTVDRDHEGWTGNIGVVPQLLDRLLPLEPQRTILMCCGPEVMMRYVVRSALARGIAKERMFLSTERHMQCAVALCGHCQLGPAFLCREGPTFRYDVIEPYLNVEGL